MSKNPTDAYDAEGKTVMGQIEDPTAQTGLLTIGQQIVAQWEADTIAEPYELARLIDVAIGRLAFDCVVLKKALGDAGCPDWLWCDHTVSECAKTQKKPCEVCSVYKAQMEGGE